MADGGTPWMRDKADELRAELGRDSPMATSGGGGDEAATAARAAGASGDPQGRPSYETLIGRWAARRLTQTPDIHDNYPKEIRTAGRLRRILGIELRSVLRIDDETGLLNPDAVWDVMRVTVDIKGPESTKPSVGQAVRRGARKAQAAVFDMEAIPLAQAEAIMARAMGGHGRGDRLDHVLVIGVTEGDFWHFWQREVQHEFHRPCGHPERNHA